MNRESPSFSRGECQCPEHHRAKENGCVDRHIIEAEKLIGRELKDEEVVHHKDNDRSNYSACNLMVFINQESHARFHKTGVCVEMKEKNVFSSSKQYVDTCVGCGAPISRTKHNKCRLCLSLDVRKVKRPSKEELNRIIQQKSMCAIGRLYGVSDNAIRKWCKSYGINFKKA